MEGKAKRNRWIVGLAAGMLIIAVPAISILLMFRSFSRESAAFLLRAREVDPAIEAVYLDYYRTGQWPATLQQLKLLRVDAIPSDWQYYLVDDPGVGIYPVLRLRGPFHMRLEYAFRENGDPQSPGGWKSKMEGDPVKNQFHESIPPKPKEQPARLD